MKVRNESNHEAFVGYISRAGGGTDGPGLTSSVQRRQQGSPSADLQSSWLISLSARSNFPRLGAERFRLQGRWIFEQWREKDVRAEY